MHSSTTLNVENQGITRGYKIIVGDKICLVKSIDDGSTIIFQNISPEENDDYVKWNAFIRHFGKVTLAALIFIAFVFCMVFAVVKAEAATPLEIAQSEIGHGEIGGNNLGVYVRQYLNGQEKLPWCAGFISYCFAKAGYLLPYTLRAKEFLKLGTVVRHPQPNDVLVLSRQGGGHVGIVKRVTKNTVITIEGNKGEFPAVVKEVVYSRYEIPNFLGYVRICREG